MVTRAQIVQSDPSLQRRFQLANALGGQAVSAQPIASPIQGAAQLAQALASVNLRNRATSEIQERQGQAQSDIASALARMETDPRGAAAALTQNPDTANVGLQMALQYNTPEARAAEASRKAWEAQFGTGGGTPIAPQSPRGLQYAAAGQQAAPGGPINLVPEQMQPQAASATGAPMPSAATPPAAVPQPQPAPSGVMARMQADPDFRQAVYAMGPERGRQFLLEQQMKEGEKASKLQKAAFEGADKLRDEFTAQSKDFRTARDAYGRVLASAESPSAAGDLALIFNYMKVLDPGSVVRESEFATAQNAAGVPARIRNIYNQVMTGQRLSGQQRGDFVDRAGKLYDSQLDLHNQLREQYTGLAQRFEIDPRNVVTDMRGNFARPDPGALGVATANQGAPSADQALGGQAAAAPDLSNIDALSAQDIAAIDIQALTPEQQRALEARMTELGY